MGLFSWLFGSNIYNANKWEENGDEMYRIASDLSEKSDRFIQRIIGSEIHRVYGDPRTPEVLTATRAFRGLVQAAPEKNNAYLMELLSFVVNIGRHVFKTGEDSEIMSLPTYLNMIGDYYNHFGPDDLQMMWFATTTPDIPFDKTFCEGKSIWTIASLCLGILEEHLIQTAKKGG